MDQYHEDNYRALIADGTFAVDELRAIAAERDDPDLLRLCDEFGTDPAPADSPPPVPETAATGPEENTSKPKPTRKG